MTNKLVVIINSLKVPKIKILLYEIKFIVLKLQLPPEPLTMGLPPPDPCPLSSTEFVDPPPQKKILGMPLVPLSIGWTLVYGFWNNK